MENNIKIYKCKYCGKEFDTGQKLGGHIRKCKKNPNYEEYINKWKKSFTYITHVQSGYNAKNICYCQYCNKECKSLNSLHMHEIYCKENPNHLESNWKKYNNDREPSNQYIKAKNEGYVYKISDETREKFRLNWLGRKHKNITKETIQNTINKKIQNNTWHNNNGVKILYKNSYFDSSWEVEFVKYLDSKNIEWIRPKKSFNYFWNNSNHKYYPDIYLPKYNLYIEIKAIANDRDFAKWDQFTEQLDIYDSEDLYKLGIIQGIDKRHIIDEKYKYKHINLGEEA